VAAVLNRDEMGDRVARQVPGIKLAELGRAQNASGQDLAGLVQVSGGEHSGAQVFVPGAVERRSDRVNFIIIECGHCRLRHAFWRRSRAVCPDKDRPRGNACLRPYVVLAEIMTLPHMP
jgi:hypothetical protein